MNVLHNEIYSVLTWHLEKYPEMELQDMVKLLYQNEFGPGHMIEREEKSLAFLEKEWHCLPHSNLKQDIPASGCPDLLNIGNHLMRIDIRNIPFSLLPVLNRIFVKTANAHKGSLASFEEKLRILRAFLSEKGNYSAEKVDHYLNKYKNDGYPALSHSETYRAAYSPAYRVILDSYLPYLTIYCKVTELLNAAKAAGSLPVVIGIDGRCASGKTSLSSFLADFIDCNVIHMDDFFLPPSLRSRERLEEPGGNIHYERFYEEVVTPILTHRQVSFRQFSCKKMDYQDMITLPHKPLIIVEGSYCMRQEFRSIYHYKIFLTCPYEEQLARIRMRNGEEMLSAFVEKWIPMENKYFDTCKIAAHCDLIVDKNYSPPELPF